MVGTAAGATATRAKARPISGLEAIREQSQAQVEKIRDRVAKSEEATKRLNEIAAGLQDAMQRGDVDTVKILEADYNAVRQDVAAVSHDLAGAMIGLAASYKDIGIELKGVNEFKPEEQQLINDANALVKRVEGRLASANTQLAEAEQKWSWFGIRRRAVDAAKAAIAKAEGEVDAAKAAVGTATQAAELKRRQRLENASLEDSMQHIQTTAQEIIEIAQARIADIQSELEIIESSRVALLETQKDLAKQVENGDKALGELKAQVENLQAERDEQVPDSPEWNDANARLVATSNEYNTAEGERNKAFALLQDGKRFLEMYKVQEAGQRDALAIQQTWIGVMQAGVQHRSDLFNSMLVMLQTVGDQQAMSLHDSVATETDENVQKMGVESLAAMRRGMLERMQRMPEQTKRMEQLTEAEARSRADFESGVQELIRQIQANFNGDAQRAAA